MRLFGYDPQGITACAVRNSARGARLAIKVPESKASFLASLCRRRIVARCFCASSLQAAPPRCLRFILGSGRLGDRSPSPRDSQRESKTPACPPAYRPTAGRRGVSGDPRARPGQDPETADMRPQREGRGAKDGAPGTQERGRDADAADQTTARCRTSHETRSRTEIQAGAL
jgi:hypothetical protein